MLDHRFILAAGGLVWRPGPDGVRLAVVHRPRHRDWGLPKGKLGAGERWQDAALREVLEETGAEADLEDLADVVLYEVGGIPKIVLFWNMSVRGEPSPVPPGDEIDEVAWLDPRGALGRLDHAAERSLVEREARRRGIRDLG